MPNPPDLRTRIAEALRKAIFCDPDWGIVCNPDQLADILLSLLGIAIVQLPEPKTVKPGLVLLHDGWVSARRARELAADLLASAAAAEADHA